MFLSVFTCQVGLSFCHNLTSLFEEIGIACNPNDWFPFIDSSSRHLKAVQLHNGNMYRSLTLAHSVQPKDEYSSEKILSSIGGYRIHQNVGPSDGFLRRLYEESVLFFVFGTAGTPWHTTTGVTGHSGHNSVMGGTTSNRDHCWMPGMYCFLYCT